MRNDAGTKPGSIGRAVAELRRSYPEVSISSLRFLEREGLIDPIRTPGGHRLFRPSDIERIHRIKEWQERRLSLAEIRERLEAADNLVALTALCQAFLEHATQGEPAAAIQPILTADELGVPISQIFAVVLTPALFEVGERWAAGTLQVGQEHEISELARNLIAELTLRHSHVSPDQPAVVAAGVADERHDLGLRMVTGLLRVRGLNAHFLGADVAPRFLVESVRLRRPSLVLLSATLPSRLDQLGESIAELRDQGVRTSVIAGGQACYAQPDAVRALGADLPMAERLEDLIDHLIALAAAGPPAM